MMSKTSSFALLCLAAGSLAAPEPARAAIPLLAPVYVQISTTDAMARALDGFSTQLAQLYDRNTATIDEQICRRHKAALADLVTAARAWQGNRARLARSLDRLQENPSAGWIALGDFTSIHRTGLHELSEMDSAILSESASFHAEPPIAALYDSLHETIDGDVSVIRRLRAVDWQDARDDATRAQDPMQLLKLDSDFHHAETRLRVAIEHLDEQVSLPCPPVDDTTAQAAPGGVMSPGRNFGPGATVNSSVPPPFPATAQGPR